MPPVEQGETKGCKPGQVPWSTLISIMTLTSSVSQQPEGQGKISGNTKRQENKEQPKKEQLQRNENEASVVQDHRSQEQDRVSMEQTLFQALNNAEQPSA